MRYKMTDKKLERGEGRGDKGEGRGEREDGRGKGKGRER